MSSSFVLSNARLASGATVDIQVADGRISAIEPRISGDAERVDAAGRFVSPGLVESHFHLDKAMTSDRVPPQPNRMARDHMERTASIKR